MQLDLQGLKVLESELFFDKMKTWTKLCKEKQISKTSMTKAYGKSGFEDSRLIYFCCFPVTGALRMLCYLLFTISRLTKTILASGQIAHHQYHYRKFRSAWSCTIARTTKNMRPPNFVKKMYLFNICFSNQFSTTSFGAALIFSLNYQCQMTDRYTRSCRFTR